ncbi:MAG: TadE family protein [Hyphomonadaceae bacterium]
MRVSRSGAAAVEFALVAPLLCVLMGGVVSYGGYLLTAHTIQQLANDAARAAIAGLTDAERRDAAEESIAQERETLGRFLRAERLDVSAARDGAVFTVRVSYDARDNVFWSLGQLAPMPDPVVRRAASIRIGGY